MGQYVLTLSDAQENICTHTIPDTLVVITPDGPVAAADIQIDDQITVDGYTFTITDKQTGE